MQKYRNCESQIVASRSLRLKNLAISALKYEFRNDLLVNKLDRMYRERMTSGFYLTRDYAIKEIELKNIEQVATDRFESRNR